MLVVLEKCFPQHFEEWESKIIEMIPSYGVSLVENPELFHEIHTSTALALGLSENLPNQVNSLDVETKVLEKV
jgi:malate dehydrogenase (quinone)